MLKNIVRILPLILLASALLPAHAASIPTAISYQGKLAEESGKPVPDGTYLVEFRIYNSEKEEKPIWQSKPMMVNTVKGLFITMIGDIPTEVFDCDTPYLETWVEEKPLSPRQPIVSVGFAFRAAKADNVADGAISNRQVSASAAIDPAKVAGTAWTSQNDGAGSGLDADTVDGMDTSSFVKTGDTDSVTGQMIQNGSIGSADLSLPTSLTISSSTGAVLKAYNTSPFSGYGVRGSTGADGSSSLAAGVVGDQGSSLRYPLEWNTNYKRMGIYGYSAYSGSSAAASGHGVVGWSERGYGGLFHSTASHALVTDGTSYLGGSTTLAGNLAFSGTRVVSAPSGVTIDGPGELDVVVTSSDITIKGDASNTYVKILSDGSIQINAAGNMNITAGNTLNLSGTIVKVNSAATTQIKAGGIVDVDGSLVTLN